MQNTITGDEIVLKVKETISALGLDIKILNCITTNGRRNMCEIQKGLVGNVLKAILESGTGTPMAMAIAMRYLSASFVRKKCPNI